MKKNLRIKLKAAGLIITMLACMSAKAQNNLSTQDYVNLTMNLQGILELKMITDPNIHFDFNTLQKYSEGITIYDATVLEINSTARWELYVQPASQYWTQESGYTSNNLSENILPSEILELKCETPNISIQGKNFNHFIGLTSNSGENVYSKNPGFATQFLAGEYGQSEAGEMTRQRSGTSLSENKFRIAYRIRPGSPANFPDLSAQYPLVSRASFGENKTVQPGFYSLEIIYTLTEDL